MPLRDTSMNEGDERNFYSNLASVIFAFTVLYGFYAAFFILWIEALNSFGNKLLWFFFGLFLSAFGGMASLTVYSMSKQQVGWFLDVKAPDVTDDSIVLCGYKWY